MTFDQPRSLRLLIVDDDIYARRLVSRHLHQIFADAEMTEVADAETFQQTLEQDGFDLVVTDYQLHWSTGLEILQSCKMQWPDCPVIMFTATGNEEIAVEAMKAGLGDYILKSPEHLPRLSTAAKTAIERAAHRRALEAAEVRYRTLFDRVPVGLYRATIEGQLLDVNQTLVHLLGYPNQETLLAVSLTDLYAHREDYEHCRKLLTHHGEANDLEVALRGYDGGLIWVRKSVRGTWRHTEELLLCEGFMEDITARKQTEAALRASEARLRAIFNSGPQAITLIDPDYKIQAFNDLAQLHAEAVFGQTMQIGDSIYEYVRPEDVGTFNQNFQSALRGRVTRLEKGFTDVDQPDHWFEFVYNPVVDGDQVQGVCLSVVSIDDRKRMEAAMVKNEKRYRAIIQDQTELICRFLDEETITFVNDAYCRYFDQTRQALLHSSFMDHIIDADKPTVRQQIERLSPKNPLSIGEYRVVRPNGEVRWMQWHNRAIFDERGHIIEYQSVGRDITEHRQAKESLEQRNLELTLLNRAGQAFISTLELDQVLNSVLEEVKKSLNVVACSAWLVDRETKELVCRQVTDPQSEIVRGWRLAPGTGLGGWVVQNGESLIVADVLESDKHFKGVDQETGLPLRSILTVPLRTKKGVIGVLQMVDATVARFDEADQRLGEALGVFAASAIENAQLYEQAQKAAETKAIMLDEINHRVKNNLAAIIGLLYAERRHTGMENEVAYQTVMKNLINRVQGLATVHSLLSEAGWAPLPLSEVANQIIHTALQALLPGKQVSVRVAPSPVRVLPKQAHSLALVINELTTNTIKYALAEQDDVTIEVNISLDGEPKGLGQMVIFEFRDDGPGYPPEVLRLERHDVGLYMIQSIVRTDLQGTLTLDNDHGAMTTVCFKLLA